MGLGAHDRILFVIAADGEVRLKRPAFPTIASLRGAAGSLPSPMTWQEMREVVREDHLRAKYARSH